MGNLYQLKILIVLIKLYNLQAGRGRIRKDLPHFFFIENDIRYCYDDYSVRHRKRPKLMKNLFRIVQSKQSLANFNTTLQLWTDSTGTQDRFLFHFIPDITLCRSLSHTHTHFQIQIFNSIHLLDRKQLCYLMRQF